MSVEENKAVVRRLVDEVYNRRNLAVVDELVAEDFTGYQGSDGSIRRGRDGYKTDARAILEPFEGGQFSEVIDDLIGEGNELVFRWTSRGVTATGETINMTGISIVTVADGTLVEAWESKAPTAG